MGTSITLSESAPSVSPSAANVIARVGCSSDGTANSINEWDGGQDAQIADTLGYGKLTESSARALSINGVRCVTVQAAGSAGTVGSVTHTGSGAAITAAASGSSGNIIAGPFDDYPLLTVKITTAGALGTAKCKVALDGSTYGSEIDMLDQLPATVIGTADLSAITLSTLTADTFIVTPDGGSLVTTTFTLPASVADIAAQIQTALGSSGHASIVGGKYLKVTGVTKGTTGTLLVGAGTGNTILGMTAASTPGTASKYTVPKVGVVLTFPSGTYVVRDTFAIPCTGPRMSITQMNTALDALRTSGVKFGKVIAVQEPVDGTDLLAWAQALDTKVDSWHNDSEDRIFPLWMLGAPLGTTSATGAGDATNDLDVRTLLTGYTTRLGAVMHGDIYCTGHDVVGSFRRSLSWTAGESCAGHRMSADLGNGGFAPMELASALGPDGVTRMRDENKATIKMRAAGFTVAIRQGGSPRFKRGVTRAGTGSKFESLGVLSMAYETARVVYERSLKIENTDPYLSKTGTIRNSDADAYESVYNADLRQFIIAPGHATAAFTSIDRAANISSTKSLSVTWTVQEKGQIEEIVGTVSIVGELVLS